MALRNLLFFLISSALLLSAQESVLSTLYKTQHDAESAFNRFLEKEIQSLGFSLADPHFRVNDQYEKVYGSTTLDMLSFIPIVHDKTTAILALKDPRIATFAPFSILAHKKKSQQTTTITHLSADAMLDMAGITDEAIKKEFKEIVAKLDAKMQQFFAKRGITFASTQIPYKNSLKEKTFRFIYTFERDEEFDIDDFLESFQNRFELAFIDKGYLIAGYYNFFDSEVAEEMLEEKYEAFWSYSLCHLRYSYALFDGKEGQPDAGMFAPCTINLFIPKESNRLYLQMARLSNVKEALSIDNPKHLDWIERLDYEIPEILAKLGFKAIKNSNPLTTKPQLLTKQPNPSILEEKKRQKSEKKVQMLLQEYKHNQSTARQLEQNRTHKAIETPNEVIEIVIPEPPKPPEPPALKVIKKGKKDSSNNNILIDDTSRTIRFSKRIPPGYKPAKIKLANTYVGESSTIAGDISNGKVAVSLIATGSSIQEVQQKLKAGGFKIIDEVDIAKDLSVIIFSEESLLELAKVHKQPLLGELRALVDTKHQRVSITNPLYFQKAFLKEKADQKSALKTLQKLHKAFGKLQNSDERVKYSRLSSFRFMKGMPGFEDKITLSKGNNLSQKLKQNGSYYHRISDSLAIAGINFSKRTQGFIKKIGTSGAFILPYPIVLVDDTTYILDPKYLIALFYPGLEMSQFMTIATIPGAIEKECKKVLH